MAKRATTLKNARGEERVRILFTGKAGGSSYSWEGRTLTKGETVDVALPLAPHWKQLVKSGDAELV